MPGMEDFLTTRFWWVRHAPVRSDGGKIYGQRDLPADCGDSYVFQALARILPAGAVWITSNLMRTKQTAAAIRAAGHPDANEGEPIVMTEFAEQNLGDWQGLDRAQFFRDRRPSPSSYWFNDPKEKAPNGESFLDLVERTRDGIGKALSAHRGRDLIVCSHGGTIRAAIGVALDLSLEGMLSFMTENCAVTRLDMLERDDDSGWRVMMVNHQPWMGASPAEAKLA
ncbi:MAG: histidine phosphatase family protein [Hyphomicrobiales bacterium]|nr:histidine phosphatase family protein [Hyphomicrobiales bacterium]